MPSRLEEIEARLKAAPVGPFRTLDDREMFISRADIERLLAVAKAIEAEMEVRCCLLCQQAWNGHKKECPMFPLMEAPDA